MADISKLSFPDGGTYDIKDAVARDLISGLGKVVTFVGVTTDDLGANPTKNPINLADGTSKTCGKGCVAIYGSQEFLQTADLEAAETTNWVKLGDTEGLGDLAYKDNVSGTYLYPAASETEEETAGTPTGNVSSVAAHTPEGDVILSSPATAGAGDLIIEFSGTTGPAGGGGGGGGGAIAPASAGTPSGTIALTSPETAGAGDVTITISGTTANGTLSGTTDNEEDHQHNVTVAGTVDNTVTEVTKKYIHATPSGTAEVTTGYSTSTGSFINSIDAVEVMADAETATEGVKVVTGFSGGSAEISALSGAHNVGEVLVFDSSSSTIAVEATYNKIRLNKTGIGTGTAVTGVTTSGTATIPTGIVLSANTSAVDGVEFVEDITTGETSVSATGTTAPAGAHTHGLSAVTHTHGFSGSDIIHGAFTGDALAAHTHAYMAANDEETHTHSFYATDIIHAVFNGIEIPAQALTSTGNPLPSHKHDITVVDATKNVDITVS